MSNLGDTNKTNILDKMEDQIKANKGIRTPIFKLEDSQDIRRLDTIDYVSIQDQYSLAYMLYNYFFKDRGDFTRKVMNFNYESMYIPSAKEVYNYLEYYKNNLGIILPYSLAKANITADYITRETYSRYNLGTNYTFGFMFTYRLNDEYTNLLYNDRMNNNLLGVVYNNIHNRFRLYRTMICYCKDYREYNCGYPIMRIFITNRPRVNTGNKYYCSTSLSKDINKVRQDLAMCIRNGINNIYMYRQSL